MAEKPIEYQAAAERDCRNLVWEDAFHGAEIDRSKWQFLRTMNHRDLIYDNSIRHARVEDGKLHLQVHRAENTWSLCEGLTTKETTLFRYGYLEMRAKLPFRHAAWPSLWMLCNTPFHDEGIGWFAEIDIFEVFSSVDHLSPNLHKWGKKGHEMLPGEENNQKRAHYFENAAHLNDEYHVYGFSWDAHSMKFFVDGAQYFEYVIDGGSRFVSETYPDVRGFHEPAYININNQVFTPGGDWCPPEFAITPEDEMPIDYYIDYIRLYQKAGETLYTADEIAKTETARAAKCKKEETA